MAHVDKRIEDRRVSDLRPNILQAETFPEPTEEQVNELAANIDANGLIDPVEIKPNNTIICGHKRVQAVTKLGWKTIACWIRDDIDDDAADQRFIDDNLLRRQLGPIAMARSYKTLKEIELRKGPRYRQKLLGRDLRDHLATKLDLHCSGKTLERLVRLLDLPLVLQHAIDRGQMLQSLGLGLVKLNRKVQEAIAARVIKGADPNSLTRNVLERERQREQAKRLTGDGARSSWELLRDVMRGMNALVELQHREEEVDVEYLQQWLPNMTVARKVMSTLIARAPRPTS